jgi:hypothetical protein
LFYMRVVKKSLVIFDTENFFARWRDGFNLIFHIFYYKFVPVVFSSPYFKNETLALNWHYTSFDINLWRYYFPFLVFKPNTYNHKITYYFNKLASLGTDFYLISDAAYHFKHIYYMSKCKLYSVGLISANMNPWLLSYPIIGFFDSYVTQFFFLKLLICEDRRAQHVRYFLLKNYWWFFLLKLSRA